MGKKLLYITNLSYYNMSTNMCVAQISKVQVHLIFGRGELSMVAPNMLMAIVDIY